MINKNIRKKRKIKHHTYTKKAFLKNLKKVLEYCIETKNLSFLNENIYVYKYYCKKFHLNINKYECKITKATSK